MDQNDRTKQRLLTWLGVIILFFVGVSLVGYFRNQSKEQKNISKNEPSQVQKSGENIEIKPSKFPEVKVGAWTLIGAASIVGTEQAAAPTYEFLQNLERADFKRLGFALGTNPPVIEETPERISGGTTTQRAPTCYTFRNQRDRSYTRPSERPQNRHPVPRVLSPRRRNGWYRS